MFLLFYCTVLFFKFKILSYFYITTGNINVPAQDVVTAGSIVKQHLGMLKTAFERMKANILLQVIGTAVLPMSYPFLDSILFSCLHRSVRTAQGVFVFSTRRQIWFQRNAFHLGIWGVYLFPADCGWKA